MTDYLDRWAQSQRLAVVDELLMTATGKVQKFQLRDQAARAERGE